jgi:TM2 domain-containing membrane protein YozV
MQIYITKGVEQIGPFSEEEIRGKLESGSAKGTDLAWCEGSSDWVPLSEILPIAPVPSPPPPPDYFPAVSDAVDMEIGKSQRLADIAVSDSNNGPPPVPQPSVAPPINPAPLPVEPSPYTKEQKAKKLISGILAILLGWLGVHKLYLGYTVEGVIMLVVSLIGFLLCGFPTMAVGIVGLIEGIIYLTKSDDAFVETYLVGRKGWF